MNRRKLKVKRKSIAPFSFAYVKFSEERAFVRIITRVVNDIQANRI